MLMINYPFPPVGVNADILQPSAEYRKGVINVTGALMLFFIVYLLIICISLVMVAGAVVLGILIIVSAPHFLTITIGGAIGAIGILLLIYLVKFLFSKRKTDRSNMMEIWEDDEPELFEFIRQISKETGTRFPKKIYLTTEVNASVFYDSSFFSMFLPVKKNLHIGLGLVNQSTLSELKAVIAHEFGHFSQRSMKAGSYVYQVNRVVYDMLYDNQGYTNIISGFARVSGVFALAGQVTAFLISNLQKLMAYMYNIVNIRNLKLSREMEFHADAIAVSVSGPESLITSLRRMEIAQAGYDRIVNICNAGIPKNLKPENLFPLHSQAVQYIAQDYKIPYAKGLPEVKPETFSRFYQSKVRLKNLWASHPSVEDREKHVQSLNIPPVEIISDSAWNAFKNPLAIQKKMTLFLFSKVEFDQHPVNMDEQIFDEEYIKMYKRYQFHEVYNGYYDNGEISRFDTGEYIPPPDMVDPSVLFSPDNTILLLQKKGIEEDIQLLKSITAPKSKIRYFEYENVKYPIQNAALILEKCEKTLRILEEKKQEDDRKLFYFFRQKSSEIQAEEQYISLYENATNGQQMTMEYMDTVNELISTANRALASSNLDEAKFLANTLTTKDHAFKEKIKSLLENSHEAEFISEDTRRNLEIYIDANAIYYIGDTFIGQKFQDLQVFLVAATDAVHQISTIRKKQLLDYQLQFIL